MNFPFKVVSLFSGGGGSSTGYRMAGGKVVLAVECDDNAVETYRINHPKTAIYHGDIAKLSAADILKRARLKTGELDILDGSPPCQGFSIAGKRMIDDPRNFLFKEYIRILQGLKPKTLVMENVSGLVKGKMKLVFRDILTELKDSGYRVKARLMNAKYYGVPQSRERVIFIGVREDLAIEPIYPKPVQHPITVQAALKGVTVGDYPQLSEKSRMLWYRIPVGGSVRDVFDIQSHFSDVMKINPARPAPTLLKLTTGRGYATLCHWKEPRPLSINEAKRLHSFPDDYVLTGTYPEQWARIGNSVPPLLMKAIAEHIRDNILVKAGK